MDDCCKNNQCGSASAKATADKLGLDPRSLGGGGCESCQCKPVQEAPKEEAACCGGGCCQ